MTDEKQDEKGTQKPKTPQTPFGGWRNASTQSQNSEADKEPRAVVTNEDGSQRPADEDDLNMPKYSGNEANSAEPAIKSFSATFGQVKEEEPAPLPPVAEMWEEPETPAPPPADTSGAFAFVSSGTAEMVENNPEPTPSFEMQGSSGDSDDAEQTQESPAGTPEPAMNEDDPFAWKPEDAPAAEEPRRSSTGGESWMQANTSYEELQSSTRAALEEAAKADEPVVEQVEVTPAVNPYTFGKEEGWVAPPMDVDTLNAENEKLGFEFRAPEPEVAAEPEEEPQPSSPFELSSFAEDDATNNTATADIPAEPAPIAAAAPQSKEPATAAETPPPASPEATPQDFAFTEASDAPTPEPEQASPVEAEADSAQTEPDVAQPVETNASEGVSDQAIPATDSSAPASASASKTKFQAYKPAAQDAEAIPEAFALNPQEAALLGADEASSAAEEAPAPDFMMAAPQPEAPAESPEPAAPQEEPLVQDAPIPAAAPESPEEAPLPESYAAPGEEAAPLNTEETTSVAAAEEAPAPDFMMAAPQTEAPTESPEPAAPQEEPLAQDAPIPAAAPESLEEAPLPESYAAPSEEAEALPEEQADATAWQQPAPEPNNDAPLPEDAPTPSFDFASPAETAPTTSDDLPPVPTHPEQPQAYQSEMPHHSGMEDAPVPAEASAPEQWNSPEPALEAAAPTDETWPDAPQESTDEAEGWQPEMSSADFATEAPATEAMAQPAATEYHTEYQANTPPQTNNEPPAEFPAQPTATSAPKQISHSPEDVQAILQDHITWLNSGGKEGRRANFRNANLQQYDLSNQQLTEASFRGANLYGVNFSGCDMRGADLSEAQLSASIFDSSGLAGTVFSRADLRGAHFANSDLQGADFNSAFLGGATLAQLNLSSSVFLDADLQGANLTQSSLISANLRGANLSYANLTAANLSGANCRDVRFDQAVLDNAVMEGANLKNTSLQGASLLGTDLSAAGDGSSEQRQDALQAEKEQIMQEWQRIKEYEGQIQHLQSSIQQREMALQTERVNTERSRRELRAQREVLETLIHKAQDVMSNHRKHDRRLKFYGVFWFMLTILAAVGMMMFIGALDTATLGWMEIGMVVAACALVLWLFIATTMRSIKLSNNLKQLLDTYEQHLPPSDQTGH